MAPLPASGSRRPPSSSLVGRVARSAALFAAGSALLTAAVTTVLAGVLLQNAEDRRLRESAIVLLRELEIRLPSGVSAAQVVRDEHEETLHAGTRFAVLGPDGTFVAGDDHVQRPALGSCETDRAELSRACTVALDGERAVVAASAHTPQTRWFVFAAAVAVAFSGLMTWASSRPVARAALSPLSRLRARVDAIDVDAVSSAELGPPEQAAEVETLRITIAHLIQRVGAALDQANRFSANAAHELRTPLTAVRAEIELLSERAGLPSEVHDHLAALQVRVVELGKLVERLLILATPRRGAEEPDEVVSLRDMMEDVIHTLPPDQRERIQLGDADALVRGDAALLATMFTNGLSNALKFGREVRVGLTTLDGEAVIAITDDGPGIDEAARERVFEPFYRGADALRQRLPGHGLGLALVRHVAESHGGAARFAAPQGPGACLQIRLPECNP